MTLPAEIRLEVLRHVLCEEEVKIPPQPTGTRVHWGVLRTCRQLYIEGVGMAYGKNTFCTSAKDLIAFADRFMFRVGRRNASLIRHIKINVDSLGYEPMLNEILLRILGATFGVLKLDSLTWEMDLDLYNLYQHKLICDCYWSGLQSVPYQPHLQKLVGSRKENNKNVKCILMAEDKPVGKDFKK